MKVFFEVNTSIVNNIIIANVYAVLALIAVLVHKKKKKENIYYFRERPKKLSAALINYYYKGNINDNIIWITLLDLIAKRYYKIDKINGEYVITWQKEEILNFDNYDLNEYEKELANYINVVIIDNNKGKSISLIDLKNSISVDLDIKYFVKKFHQLFKEEINKSYGFINKKTKYMIMFILTYIYYIISFGIFNEASYIQGITFSFIIIFISVFIKNIETKSIKSLILIIITYIFTTSFMPLLFNLLDNNEVLNIFIKILPLMLVINPILIIINILILKLEIYNKKQQELINEIKGLKKFLEEFSTISEKELGHIVLLEQYYALAVALEVKIENIVPNELEYNKELDSVILDQMFDVMILLLKSN